MITKTFQHGNKIMMVNFQLAWFPLWHKRTNIKVHGEEGIASTEYMSWGCFLPHFHFESMDVTDLQE